MRKNVEQACIGKFGIYVFCHKLRVTVSWIEQPDRIRSNLCIRPLNNGYAHHFDPVSCEDLVSPRISHNTPFVVRSVQFNVQIQVRVKDVQLEASLVVDIEFDQFRIDVLEDHLGGRHFSTFEKISASLLPTLYAVGSITRYDWQGTGITPN